MNKILQIIFLAIIITICVFAVWAIVDNEAKAQLVPEANPIALNTDCVLEIETALAREAKNTPSTQAQFQSYVACLNNFYSDIKTKVRPVNVVLEQGKIKPQQLLKWHLQASSVLADTSTIKGLILVDDSKTLLEVKTLLK